MSMVPYDPEKHGELVANRLSKLLDEWALAGIPDDGSVRFPNDAARRLMEAVLDARRKKWLAE